MFYFVASPHFIIVFSDLEKAVEELSQMLEEEVEDESVMALRQRTVDKTVRHPSPILTASGRGADEKALCMCLGIRAWAARDTAQGYGSRPGGRTLGMEYNAVSGDGWTSTIRVVPPMATFAVQHLDLLLFV